jgi:S-adenosylmethionine:tRNA-ribosyltransferase-isomerase (queuine synthetase)
MRAEWYDVPADTVGIVTRTNAGAGRFQAVDTTSARGLETVGNAAAAVAERYRLYSYGDAMAIV